MPLKPGFRRPVIIHRAILGSVERFSAILIEHLAGKWPFWLSPRQVIVCPISEKAMDYCESVYLYFHKLGYEAQLDRSQGNINKKVRNAQIEQWNYILVAGEAEMNDGLVDVRTRDNVRHGKIRVDEVARMLAAEALQPSNSFKKFYEKAFDPAKFFKDAAGEENKVGGAKSAAADSSHAKLSEIEQTLSSGRQWLSAANMPSAEDAAAFAQIKSAQVDPSAFPNAFAWYSLVSKFSPEKQAAWK